MIEVHVGDCREVMKSLPSGSVDLVIADPPYGDTACSWDQQVSGWLEELPRVMAPGASLWCFGSMRFFMERAADFSVWQYAQDIVWEKHNGSNAFADRFRRVHEHCIQFYPPGVRWGDVFKKPIFSNDATARTTRRKKRPQQWGEVGAAHYVSEDGGPRLMRSVLCVRSEHGRAIHETQKPVALLMPLIEYSAPPSGLILDPFAGSGSTGIAARAMGRRSILIERRTDAAFAMRERIATDAPLFNTAANPCA